MAHKWSEEGSSCILNKNYHHIHNVNSRFQFLFSTVSSTEKKFSNKRREKGYSIGLHIHIF